MNRRQILTTAGLTIPAWALVRLDDALAVLPTPTTPPAPAAVKAQLVAGRRLFDAGNHTQLVNALPDLLAAAHQLGDTKGAEHYETVASCYELATHALAKIGRHPASRLTADRAVTYARLSGVPESIALASRALSIVLRHEGRPHLAQQVNMAAISELEATGLTTPTQRAVYIQMMCSTAYTAAQAQDRTAAVEWATEADRALRGLPDLQGQELAPVIATVPTPAQVQLYKVSMFWALGDSAAALESARGLTPAQFPTPERRARLHTDLARAWSLHGRPGPTAQALLAAYRQAPAEVVDRPRIRRIATDVIARHPHAAGVRELHTILRSHGSI